MPERSIEVLRPDANDRDVVAQDLASEGFLTPGQEDRIAQRLNDMIDIPFFLSEEQERRIFLKIVQAIDRNIYRVVPREILDIANATGNGVGAGMARVLRQRLPSLIADLVPLPFLPDFIIESVIETFLDILLGSMARGRSLDEMLGQL